MKFITTKKQAVKKNGTEAQFFIPGRYAQVIDVLTNGLGAWLGAMVFSLLIGRSKEKASFRLFALELPLMNLAYLLIPLMWLNGLAAGGEASRLWLLLLLGVFGCGVLASIYVRLKQAGHLTPNKWSLLTASWFIVASLPALATFPVQVTGFGIIIAILAQIPARLSARKKKDERRFELPTLKMLLPLYAVYLILLGLWPSTVPFQDWEFKMHFEELTFTKRIVFTFRFIEMIGAFTLFGYMTAEMRGRKKESLEAALVRQPLIRRDRPQPYTYCIALPL